ncbi:MAG: hypothetical protein AAFX04_09145 [Pseudomonadota bacterium]
MGRIDISSQRSHKRDGCKSRALIPILNASACLTTLLTGPVAAQQATPTPPPPPCSSEAHRGFDFWLGTWDVTPAGQQAPTGVNRIERLHGGCVIRESYSTKGGYSGMSMSFYDAARKRWHQTWMGADGSALYIEGGVNSDGAMVLSNKNWPGYADGTPVNRVTWTPNADGSVRQLWEQSRDGEKTWSVVFDGRYVPQATPQ